MGDRGLRLTVRLAPRRRPPVELDDEIGLAPLQLGEEEVSKLVVVPVPIALPIERHDEEVRLHERLELVRRSRGLEHCIAQWAAHPLQHCGPGQEADVARAQPGQVLEVEVVDHESVVAANTVQMT